MTNGLTNCTGVELSKLFKLKNWLTIEDAARHLGNICEGPVTSADVLQLVLDGHLKPSVNLVNGAYARPCIPVNIGEVEFIDMPGIDGRPMRIPVNGRVWQHTDGTFYQVGQKVTQLASGVWDLPMLGGERIDVEYQYQSLTNGPEVTAITLDSVFISSTKGVLYELQSRFEDSARSITSSMDPNNFHPSGGLPEDSVLVVRRSALTEVEELLTSNEESSAIEIPEKPLGSRERNGLLTALAVACRIANLDHDRPAKTAGILHVEAARMGINIGETTIEGYLKRIPEAIRTRMT